MTMGIILPKVVPYGLDKIDTGEPLFFLAGPVRGGGDWQWRCCQLLQERLDHFRVAIPCRYEENHPSSSFKLAGREDHFLRQLPWERFFLHLASVEGCIIFWLPCEGKDEPRQGDEPYAMDTRGELGEWRGRLMHDDRTRLVVGAEAGFPGISQIARNFQAAIPAFPICETLEETVDLAVAFAQSK